jgi:hypothetical protein
MKDKPVMTFVAEDEVASEGKRHAVECILAAVAEALQGIELPLRLEDRLEFGKNETRDNATGTDPNLGVDRMLTTVGKRGPTNRRTLFRGYTCQRKSIHEPVLQHLLATGRVQPLPNGLFQAAEALTNNAASALLRS